MPRLSWPHGVLRAVVALVVAVVTAGCSAIGSTASPSGSSTPPAAAPSVAAPVAPSAAAPVDSRAPDAPVLASTTVPLADDVGPGTLTFSVVDLSVRGQLTQLTLRLQTSGNPDPTLRVNQMIGSKGVGRILAPELIDPINLKAYSEADGGLGWCRSTERPLGGPGGRRGGPVEGPGARVLWHAVAARSRPRGRPCP